jgi:signal transduction histidine kinase
MLPKSLPKVDIDAGKIRQVIINLVDNAIYYTKEGSITVALSRSGDKVRLSVTDTALGFQKATKVNCSPNSTGPKMLRICGLMEQD